MNHRQGQYGRLELLQAASGMIAAGQTASLSRCVSQPREMGAPQPRRRLLAMPTSRGGHGAHEALPPAAHVAAWEQLHPGTAAAILAEFQHDRRHARAMDWARLALQSMTVLGGLGAVMVLALLGHCLAGPDGSIQARGLYLGVGSVIGVLAGRLQRVPQRRVASRGAVLALAGEILRLLGPAGDRPRSGVPASAPNMTRSSARGTC